MAALVVIVVAAVLPWQLHQRSIRRALSDLPEVETSPLEPGMAQIIAESRAAVVASPYSGRAWGKYGGVLLAQAFISEAVVSLARAEQLDPREFRWPYLRGVCLERLDPETAVKCFRQAAEIRPDIAIANVRLAEMLLARAEFDEAENRLRAALALSPRDPRVLLALGRLAFLRRELDDALRWTSEAVQVDPQRRSIRLLLCQILQGRGDQVALAEQMQVLDSISETASDTEWMDPYLAEVARYKRGTMWTLQVATQQIFAGQIPQAIALLEKSGGENASDARIVVLLGKAYLRSEQLNKAEEVLKRAVEKDPASAPAHFELGNLAMVQGRWNDAAEHYRETVRLQPDMAAAHYNIGLYHQHRGEREEAISAFKLACRYMPTNFPAHREIAEVLLEVGRGEEAKEHLDVAARLVPTDAKLQGLIDRARSRQESP